MFWTVQTVQCRALNEYDLVLHDFIILYENIENTLHLPQPHKKKKLSVHRYTSFSLRPPSECSVWMYKSMELSYNSIEWNGNLYPASLRSWVRLENGYFYHCTYYIRLFHDDKTISDEFRPFCVYFRGVVRCQLLFVMQSQIIIIIKKLVFFFLLYFLT